jgi:UDP:flavonoid glycosyltransferase YjiC (YdhE family)
VNRNVVLIALGSAGDVHPFLALGQGLQARGHRVTLLTNDHFAGAVHSAGLEFTELGTAAEYCAVIERPEVWDPIRCVRPIVDWVVLRPLRQTFALIAERYLPGTTVVVAPITALGARIAQEKLGVPLVTVALYPSLFRSAVCPPVQRPLPLTPSLPRSWNRFWYWLADVALFDRLIGPEVNAFRAELGLAPVRRSFAEAGFSPECVLGMFPNWFGPPQADWPAQVRLTGFPLHDGSDGAALTPDAEEFLDAGAPPIVFSPGSAMRHGRAFFAAAVDACRRLGCRAILVSPFRDQVPCTLPAGIHYSDALPFSKLFSRAAAVVHHGGIGTSALGLAAGVPQLVMPMAYDQHDNAARLVVLGVARVLEPRSFRGPRVARELAALLDCPAVSARCRALAGRLQQADSLTASCLLIEQVVSSGETRHAAG